MKKIKVVSKPKEKTESEELGRMQRGYLKFETFSDIQKRRDKVDALLKKYA